MRDSARRRSRLEPTPDPPDHDREQAKRRRPTWLHEVSHEQWEITDRD
jgi:hypothetical protein